MIFRNRTTMRHTATQRAWLRLTGLLVGVVVVSMLSVAQAQQGDSEEGGPGGDGPPQGGPPPALVRVGQVAMEVVQQKRLITGRIQAIRQSMVAAEESGRVIVAPPDPGTPVKQGEVLCKLDAELLTQQRDAAAAQLREAQADIGRVNAELVLAKKMRVRYEQLLPTDAATQVELDQSVRDEQVYQAQLALAQATIAQRKADLAAYQQRLDRMTIAAPFDGTVTAKATELGQWVAPGTAVSTLVAIGQVDAVLDVPESIVGQLATDQLVEMVVAAAGARPKGKVYRIVPDADRTARTFPVWIRVDNADGKLLPGMTVKAELPTGQRGESLVVPRDAVQVVAGGARVFAVRGGVALPVPVKVRFATDGKFVVEAELGPGEQVVTEGNERLFPGQPVQVQGPPASAPPAQP
jgi:membrane fusion protein (multidrug efflux system)